jgi:hypothetical protein
MAAKLKLNLDLRGATAPAKRKVEACLGAARPGKMMVVWHRGHGSCIPE